MFFSGLVLRIKIQKRWTSLTDYVDFCSILHGLQIAEYSTISYKIESLNESKIKVTYEEIYENVSPKEIPVWRQKMAEKQSAKKSKKMFKEVEKFILNERNNKN